MVRTFGMCAIALASCALAGTAPKPKPGDYPVHARVGTIDIAAEYLVHTLPGETTNFLVPEYLVVEIAIYPPKSQAVAAAAGQFRLRVNGKKEEPADGPEMVAMSLAPMMQGRQSNAGQATDPDRPPPQTAAEAAVALAFPDGPCQRPVSGYLYFRYGGRTRSITSLELIWQRGEEQATIRLF